MFWLLGYTAKALVGVGLMLFNTENEPDLGDGGYGGRAHGGGDYEWPGSSCWCPSYKHEYPDDESLISSKVFQHQLSMALSHKIRR